MKSNIFIPNKIKVGFQERSDTYTKKLAYVVYYDNKGKLRKETSWNSWRSKDIEPQEFDNEPTSGFVLNKKVGDYSGDWGNHRQAYSRVYDPRGFEFEITINNLLYILENASCIKGKGLEGEFIYAWDGTDLVLIPKEAPEFKAMSEFSNILKENKTVKSKELIVGATYVDKKNNELIYLGKFVNCNTPSRGKQYFFFNENKGGYYWNRGKSDKLSHKLDIRNSLSGIIKCVNSECVDNYAELMDDLQHCREFSPCDSAATKLFPITEEKLDESKWNEYLYFTYRDREFSIKVYDSSWNGGSDGVCFRYLEDIKYDREYEEWRNTDRHSYWSYSYSGPKRHDMPERAEAYKELEAEFKDYYKIYTKQEVLDICKKYDMKYKQEYLQNGKEYN